MFRFFNKSNTKKYPFFSNFKMTKDEKQIKSKTEKDNEITTQDLSIMIIVLKFIIHITSYHYNYSTLYGILKYIFFNIAHFII